MNLYEINIKVHRLKMSKLVKENEQVYNSLKDKSSDYAMHIKALGDLHRMVNDIYINAPDEIQNKGD